MISARKIFALLLAAGLVASSPALAQFPWSNRQQEQQPYPPQNQQGDSDLAIRVDRLEQQLRQLTGQIEQLQYQNQQLMQQLQTQRGENPPVQQRPAQQQKFVPQQQTQNPPPLQQQTVPPLGSPQQQQQQNPQRRGDAFDPDADPDAPGRPRNLGQVQKQSPQQQPPLQGPMVLTPNSPQQQNFNQAPPPDQNPGPQQQAVVAPPSNSPKDAYDLAYGYILRRDYALAEQSFRGFLDQHSGDRNVPLATHWLGESLYQQRKYQEAANVFLDVYKKYPQSQRAPDSLLRLGQSLAQLNNKESACGSLGAVLTRYPKASPTVKKNAEDEQKRLGC